ncbi:3-deoxy-7-phosphoheptulonate synthase [Peptococcaceae bacterium SCADC1_2_3]|jgi:3-deoxy-7-phosphoheptulonate synthase|nr:3-deoxy-7-phosphoheptulonate synthase [Peptococcaceae bacterium SCADC1_2_3]KFI36661.1 3-deoxy-7-phosphoheptulonate synthase [Peptococcaceae bacterium SCADC1_2_3]KFI37520.1 3-deoxy-7-phosphoheptulonate synthase [Peptococcaceae bacterium SCADC1_2_3]HBQ28610.1 3-deoxy-7-phosphoheptulonate synthase [Desulfotomaculum sp.]
MIIVMKHNVQEEQITAVITKLQEAGFQTHLSRGTERTIIGVIGDERILADKISLEVFPGVERVLPILEPYKLTSRSFKPKDTVVQVDNLAIGDKKIHVMAGPCAVESREQLLEAAFAVKEAGATVLRGGAFKPRTSPYVFQGLEEEGLKFLAEARELTGLRIITEVMDIRTLPLVVEYADILQIGARNMQNFILLKEVAQTNKPVLLKRGFSATIEEWLLAAEYILAGGNPRVILCERGIRSFETYTRNTLDLTAVPVVKYLSHLPVVVDPSHGIGKWRFVPAMSRAALAAGADGLLIEVHPKPEEALCDGSQSLKPKTFAIMMEELRQIARTMKREL